jgi:hypothetical protein
MVEYQEVDRPLSVAPKSLSKVASCCGASIEVEVR